MDNLGGRVTSQPENARNLATAIAVLLGALAAATTLIFQLVRVWTTERATRTAEQGHITERINTAVENLGADKPVDRDGEQHTAPNLEVRVGALYALERIAQDSVRDHVQIMEILCAYIRGNARASGAVKNPLPEWKPHPHDADDEARATYLKEGDKRFVYSEELRNWAQNLLKPRLDIVTAMTIIGRRTERQHRSETVAAMSSISARRTSRGSSCQTPVSVPPSSSPRGWKERPCERPNFRMWIF